MHKQLTTSDKLHNEEDFKIRLEYKLHTNKEWMICLLQDIFFKHGGFNLVIVQNDILPERLHGIDRASVILLDKEHFSKTTFSNDLDNLEGIKTCRLFILL